MRKMRYGSATIPWKDFHDECFPFFDWVMERLFLTSRSTMKFKILRPFLFVSLLPIAPGVWAGGPVSWAFSVGSTSDTVLARITAVCEVGWHIYALDLPSDDGPLPTVIAATPEPAYTALSPREPMPMESVDPNFAMLVRYHEGTVPFTLPVLRGTADAFTIDGSVEYMACNDKTCLPPRTVRFKLDISALK